MTGPSPNSVSPAARWLIFGLLAAGAGAIALAILAQGDTAGSRDTAADEVDLSVKVANATPIRDDSQRGWTFTVVNQGPAVAEGSINLVATLPTTFDTTSLAGDGWTCDKPVEEIRIKAPLDTADDDTDGKSKTEAVTTVACSHDESLDIRKSTSLVLIGASNSERETEINVAVSGPSTDPDLVDNVAWFTIGGQKTISNPTEADQVAQSAGTDGTTTVSPATGNNAGISGAKPGDTTNATNTAKPGDGTSTGDTADATNSTKPGSTNGTTKPGDTTNATNTAKPGDGAKPGSASGTISTRPGYQGDGDEELPRTGPVLTLTSVWFGAAFIGFGYLMVDWSNKRKRRSPRPDRS